MIIDIGKTVIRTQLRRLLTLLLVVAVILFVIIQSATKSTFLGLNRYEWGGVIAFAYLLSLVIEGAFELNYIYFSDKGDVIVFRYFSMSVFNRKKNSIEIPKQLFAGYTIVTSLWGIKKKVVLSQLIKGTPVKYPAVSISSLNREQQSSLLACLDKYKK